MRIKIFFPVSLTCAIFYGILIGCSVKEKDLVGKTFEVNTFHVVEFKSSSLYWIYQKPYNCGGEGTWSIQNGKIVLGPNNSNCESTRDIQGTYEKRDLKKVKF